MRFERYAIYFCFFLAWAALIFVTTGGRSDPSWLSNWQRWDARWYEQIWLHGYPASDPRTLVFPPGYPLVTGVLSRLFFRSFLGTGIFVNLIALFAAATLISEWFARKFSVSPLVVFLFVLSSPASYFAFTSYSDLLFMFLLWLVLWLAVSPMAMPGRKGLIARAVLLFVLPWIRITGFALASWLLDRRVVAVSVLGSLALWLGFNEMIAGSPFYFLHAQELFAMPSGNLKHGCANDNRNSSKKEARMPAQKQTDPAPPRSAQTSQAQRKPWKKKTPVEVVLDQINRLRDDVAKKEEELKVARRQLQKLDEARKVLEAS